jgi:cytochrome c553
MGIQHAAPPVISANLALLALGFAGAVQAQNLEKGKEINTTCAGCHGEAGQGGSKGEYPRIAGSASATSSIS